MARRLIDTGIFIDLLRGHEPARRWFKDLDHPGLISVVTLTELLAGAESARAERAIDRAIHGRRVVRIDADIARRAGGFLRHYRGSHGLQPSDALIAASAEAEGAMLVTRNVKHFPMLEAVEAPY